MFLEILGITVLWIFLFGYVIIASIDFGAGFYNAYSLLTGNNHILSKVISVIYHRFGKLRMYSLYSFSLGSSGSSRKQLIITERLY